MNSSPRTDTTVMLRQAQTGDAAAREQLFARVYDELRTLASQQLRQGGPPTMHATALVNEACLRLLEPHKLDAQDRSHFMALASVVMRRVLVDQYRRGHREKRGGGRLKVTIDDNLFAPGDTHEAIDVLALDAALARLATLDERKARIVELRFFGGLGIGEVAAALDVSTRTIEREWHFARAWLRGELRNEGTG